MNKQNEQQPIIHYVCKECQDKGLINPPCVHFKGDNQNEMKWIDCEGVGDNNGFYEMEVPVQDNKGTWEQRFDKQFPQFKERETYFFEEVPLPTAIKSFIANERKAAQEEVVREILKRKTEYRHINYVPNESSWGFTEAVSVKDIEEVAKELNLSASNQE